MFESYILYSVKAVETSVEGIGIFKHCSGCKVAVANEDLVKEVLA